MNPKLPRHKLPPNAHYGGVNWKKRYLHSNYYKHNIKPQEERQFAKVLPLIQWRFYNMIKIKMREVDKNESKMQNL